MRVFFFSLIAVLFSSPSIAQDGCQLLPSAPAGLSLPNSGHLPSITGLSPYWAQEYTGADLVRELLQRQASSLLPEDLVHVLDTDDGHHYLNVSHLIAGPHSTATIPAPRPLPFVYVDAKRGVAEGYRTYLAGRQAAGVYPSYINNSMRWMRSEAVGEIVREIVANGSVFVTSAGNAGASGEPVDPVKVALGEQILIIGSHSPTGDISVMSQSSPAVLITAPSNMELLTYGNSGPLYFGGTSGAVPQVTGALAAFTLISGHALTNAEARQLLQRTAIPVSGGFLNSYKIAQIAERLAGRCAGDQDCVATQLAGSDVFDFPKKDLAAIEAVFPQCFGRGAGETLLSCSDKKRALTELRQEAFLHQDDPQYWGLLGCLHQELGFPVNADYYRFLAEELPHSR